MTRRERMEHRQARRLEWAASRERQASAAFTRVSSIADNIPLGQPSTTVGTCDQLATQSCDSA